MERNSEKPLEKTPERAPEKTAERPAIDREKLNALNSTLSQINKTFGKGAIMRFGDREGDSTISTVSSGCLSLDLALGIGGIPRGRIIEIFGPESSGKTTLALHIISQVQKTGGIAAFIDAEYALDPLYAKRIGVDINNLIIAQPTYGEEALEITDTLVRSGAVDVITIDSVAALIPKAELEGSMGDTFMGMQARLMSQALRKLTANISKSNCICIFINQVRDKIGVTFGPTETTTGGRALKFYSSVRLDVRKVAVIREKATDISIANRVTVKVVKNKMAPPFRSATFEMTYGEGISQEGDIVDLATVYEIVERSGSWYSYKGGRIGQGRDNAKKYLKENPAVLEAMKKEILRKFAESKDSPLVKTMDESADQAKAED